MLGPVTFGEAQDVTRTPYLKLYFRGGATVSSGSLVVEESSTPDYTGTWSPVGSAFTASTVTGSKEISVALTTGAYAYIRVREATAVSPAGSVTVVLCGIPVGA